MMSTTTASSSITESLLTNDSPPNIHRNQIRIHRLSSMTDERDAVSGPSTEDLREFDSASNQSIPVVHGVIPVPSNMEASAYMDDPLVYVNLSAIETKKYVDDIDRRPLPPFPDDDAVPLRVLPSGWQEFVSPGGRRYYYQPESKICQWKPPRVKQCNAIHQQKDSCSDAESLKEEAPKPDDSKVNQTTFPVDMVSSLMIPDREEVFSTHKPMAATMSNSVDSGYGRSSLSCRNQGFGMSRPPPEMSESVIHFDSHPPVSLPTSSKDDSYLFSRNFSTTAVKKGTLEKMKISDCGIKTKKREWIASYAYLVSGHLLFYKDQKRAEKLGKHYPAPTDVCDLRGAKLSTLDSNASKDKRRRQIIDLLMPNNTEYWFGISGNDVEVESWYNMLAKIINSLPMTKAYPLPFAKGIENGSLQRRPSDSMQSPVLSLVKSGLRSSQKIKPKQTQKDSIDTDPSPTRDSIIERLLKFFRYRPSVEQLRERGIYRPEPIFGSTLQAICQHDRTNVPIFISEITRVIEDKGLCIDGIYRVSGNLSSIQKIRCQVDQDRYDVLWKEDDIHVLTGALKLFFRELSEPIFLVCYNKEFMAAIRQTNMKMKIKTMDDLLNKLPQVHKETLIILFTHLLRVAQHSDKNRMNIHSIAIMFGPALFSTEDKPVRNTNTVDKKTIKKNKKSAIGNDNDASVTEPNQILAYKMIVFGQIVEFLLKEYSKFTAFHSS